MVFKLCFCYGHLVNSIALTGKSLLEALLFAEHGENKLCAEIVLSVKNNFCTQLVLPMFCKKKSFDKDLPVFTVSYEGVSYIP